MKTTKIVFDANPLVLNKSGIGYYVDGLIHALSDYGGKNVELVGHYFNFLGRKSPVLPQASNIRYVQSIIIPGKILGLCRKLGFQPYYELFTKTKADTLLFTNYVSLPTFFKSNTVSFIYDLGFIDCPELISEKNNEFLRRWVSPTIKNSSLIVTISNFIQGRISEHYKIQKTKIYVTPIPPIKSVLPKPSEINLKSLGIENEYILFVGTIEPRKDILTLLEAYESLPYDLRLKYSLVLAGGKGWKDEQILIKIADMQRCGFSVIATGYISDEEKHMLYRSATIFVQPSLYEGFGMPILEAMSYRKAIICSDIPVFKEVAKNAVSYFEVGNPTSLKNKLINLLRNPKEIHRLEDTGKVRLSKTPTWEDVALGLLEKLKK